MKAICSMIVAAFLFSSCVDRNQYGPCIGLADKEKPGVQYRIEPVNLFAAIFFFETIFVPAIVILSEAKRPIGKDDEK